MKFKYPKSTLYFLLLIFFPNPSFCQSHLIDTDTLIQNPVQFNKTRFYTALGIGGVIYTAGTYYLVQNWYKDYGFSKFHTFNDFGEWQHMDKIGHIYTAYNQSSVMYSGARWTGMGKGNALWFGIGMGMLLQTTVEVLDGFSPKWGFSITDMSANILGAGMFYAEQKLWDEQKIKFKVSSWKKPYSIENIISVDGTASSSLDRRANSLYGNTLQERYLKDYNAQIYWLSFNLKSIANTETLPQWLNISIGYGAENMYGGYDNIWEENGKIFNAGDNYKRYKQFYLTPDIDFSKIKTDNNFLQGFFKALNLIKLPMPGMEVNTSGKVKWHWLVF